MLIVLNGLFVFHRLGQGMSLLVGTDPELLRFLLFSVVLVVL